MESSRMEGLELLFLTDKYVAEAVYYWGNYSNKEIFKLMLQLVYLEVRCF